MRSYLKLYFNEVNKNKLLAVFLFFTNFRLYKYLQIMSSGRHMSFFWLTFFETMLFMLPISLFFFFTIDRRAAGTHLQYSLPVKRSKIVLVKFFAYTSIILILPIGFLVSETLLPRWNFLTPRISKSIILLANHGNFFLLASVLLSLVSPVIFMSGILSAAESVYEAVKRYKALTVLFFILFAQMISLGFLKLIRPLFGTYPPFAHSASANVDALQSAGDRFLTQTIFANSIILIGLGILFLFVGIVVYEKYSDV
jgi:hypothetical protein